MLRAFGDDMHPCYDIRRPLIWRIQVPSLRSEHSKLAVPRVYDTGGLRFTQNTRAAREDEYHNAGRNSYHVRLCDFVFF